MQCSLGWVGGCGGRKGPLCVLIPLSPPTPATALCRALEGTRGPCTIPAAWRISSTITPLWPNT